MEKHEGLISLRKYYGISPETLDQVCSQTSKGAYLRKENGKSSFLLTEGVALAAFYQTTVENLFFRTSLLSNIKVSLQEQKVNAIDYMDDIKKRFKNFNPLKYLRQRRNIPFDEIAKIACCPNIYTYTRLESKVEIINLETAKKLSDFYGIQIEYLFFADLKFHDKAIVNFLDDVKMSNICRKASKENLTVPNYRQIIRYLRNIHHLSISKMAKTLKLSDPRIYGRFEEENGNLSLSLIKEICDYFSIDLDVLFISMLLVLDKTKREKTKKIIAEYKSLIFWENTYTKKPNTNPKTILWYMRIINQKTHLDIYNKLNISKYLYYRAEEGFDISVEFAIKLAEYYGMSISELFFNQDIGINEFGNMAKNKPNN